MPKLSKSRGNALNISYKIKRMIGGRLMGNSHQLAMKLMDSIESRLESKEPDVSHAAADQLIKLLPYVAYKEISPDLIKGLPGSLDTPGITFNVTNYFDKRLNKIAELNNDTEVSVIDSKCQ